MAGFIKAIRPWELTPTDSLVREGRSYVMTNDRVLFAYMPEGGEMTIDLSGLKGFIIYKWYDPLTGLYSKGIRIKNGIRVILKPPYKHDRALIVSSH
jgi:hypothetical protein